MGRSEGEKEFSYHCIQPSLCLKSPHDGSGRARDHRPGVCLIKEISAIAKAATRTATTTYA